MPGKNI